MKKTSCAWRIHSEALQALPILAEYIVGNPSVEITPRIFPSL